MELWHDIIYGAGALVLLRLGHVPRWSQETRSHLCSFNLPSLPCLGSKQVSVHSSGVDARLPTALLLVSLVLQRIKIVCFSCVGPQDWGVQYVAQIIYSPRSTSSLKIFLFLRVPSLGHISLPVLPNSMWIFLTTLFVQASFFQDPVGFQ